MSEEKNNAIVVWVATYLLFMSWAIIITGFAFIQNNSINILTESNTELQTEIECQQRNERKLKTQSEIIEYLEENISECETLKREYYKWLDNNN